MAYVRAGEDGRINLVMDTAGMPDMALCELPQGFDARRIADWRLADGALVHDPAPVPPPPESAQELLLQMAGDHEYRICLMELGVTEDDL